MLRRSHPSKGMSLQFFTLGFGQFFQDHFPFQFFIIRTTLNVSIFHGILFVLYDAVLLTFIEELLFQLFGAFGGPNSPLG